MKIKIKRLGVYYLVLNHFWPKDSHKTSKFKSSLNNK